MITLQSLRSCTCKSLVLFLISLQLGVAQAQQSSPALEKTPRTPTTAKHSIVASTKQIASAVGVDVMKNGGNAIDAAIAVAFALAVTHPVAGNLGGGGFMLIRLKDGRATTIDYRETAPAAASQDMFVDASGQLIKGDGSSTVGYRSVGVPGTVAGMSLALRRYGSGRLSWAQLIEPARKLAADGFQIDDALSHSLQSSDKLGLFPESRRIFLNGDVHYKSGDILRQAELAQTLRRLQLYGPREFYQGKTARMIVTDMKQHKGLITLSDLRRYHAKERVPLRGSYRGNQVISMPPPSSGGIALVEALNILEGFDLRRMGFASADYEHLLIESLRRVFADRAEYLGDADFVRVPVNELLNKNYASGLRRSISIEKATPSIDVKPGLSTLNESSSTTHFTVVDRDGNVVANTYTLNEDYGSGVTASGTGILLNNEMDDFTSLAGAPNAYGLIQSARNAIAPRKRPLSAMSPTLILRRDGSPWFALGSPGGPRIITAVLQCIINVIDFDMNIQQAIDAPRLHHQWLPDELVFEPGGLSEAIAEDLKTRGHRLVLRPEYKGYTRDGFMGDVEAIMIEAGTGVRLGATDYRRSDGVALGY